MPTPESGVIEFDLEPPQQNAVEFDLEPPADLRGRASLAYPDIQPVIPEAAPQEQPGIIPQLKQFGKVLRSDLAQTGLTTAGGAIGQRAAAIRRGARSPVGFEGRLIGQKERTPEARLTHAIEMSSEAYAQGVDEASKEFLEASSSIPEDYGIDPKLEIGLITQVAHGTASGAAMYAMAAAGGIPLLALQGSAQAYGAAKQHGKSEDEADKESTRALIGLALFGGANKAVAVGIAKHLGKATKLRTFLTQTLGQTAGNEAASRSIAAYEAALDAEPGKRVEKAVEAISNNDAASITTNFMFALGGGLTATKNAIVKERNELRLEEVGAENIRRAQAERERTERVIAEQNAAAARLGEQRVASGVPAGPEVSAESLSPEMRARAEAAPPIITGPVVPAPQQKQEEDVQFDPETGVFRTSSGERVVIDESGASRAVPGSPEAVSDVVLGTKEKGITDAVQEQKTDAQVLRPESPRTSEGVGLQSVVETPPGTPKAEAVEFLGASIYTPGGLFTVESFDRPHVEAINKAAAAEVGYELFNKENQGFAFKKADGTTEWVDRVEAGRRLTESGELVGLKPGENLTSEHIRNEVEGVKFTPKQQAPKPVETEPVIEPAPEGPAGPPPSPPPIEDRGRPPLPSPTGIRNEKVDANRVAQGLPPRMAPLRKTFGQEWDKAMEIVDNNPDAGSALVDEITKSSRALTPTESALLAHEQVTRENAYNEALRAVNEAPNEAARTTAETILSRARDRNQETYDAGQRAGTESGQSLAFRKMLVNRDYSLAAMEQEVRALKGGEPLSKKDLADVAALHQRIKTAEDQAQKAEEKLTQVQAKDEFSKLIKLARHESSAARKEGKSILDRIISNGEAAQIRIRERNKGRSMMSVAVVDPIDFIDYVQVGAGYIARGIKGVGEFTKKLMEDFGKEIEPHGERIFNAANQYHQEATAVGKKLPSVGEAMAKDRSDKLDPLVVYEVARAHVNSGVQGFENVMAETHKSLLANHPDLTPLDVMHVFGGYGKVTRPSQEADRTILREYHTLAQLVSKIEDAMKGVAPLKSGPQRDKPTEPIRAKMAELKTAMEKNGIQVTSPEQQLANAERTAVTRLTNTVESLERQIQAKTRDQRAKGKTADTPEIKALKDRVAKLRKTLDQVAPPEGPTAESRLDRVIENTQKQIDKLDADLRTGSIAAKEKFNYTSPRLDRMRAEKEAMLKLVRELREVKEGKPDPDKRKLEAALKAVDRQVAELDRQLKSGDVQVKGKKPQVSTPALEAKRAERDAMEQFRNELRRLAIPRLTKDQQAIKAIRESMKELDRKIREGNIATKNVPHRTISPELEALRSERDAMRSFLVQLRNEAKVKRTSEEISLARYKKALATKTKAIQDRIAKGDYARRNRKETVLDKDALTARFEYQKAKDAFEKKAFEYDMSRRGGLRRAYDTTLEVLNLSRSIITSFDVSAPMRQGAFITLAHPARSLKNFPKMFRAFGSEEFAFKIQESLSDPAQRPNAALYRQAGLDLTETGPNVTRRKLEEAYQLRLIEKIPKGLGGGIVRGSQRAYTTFLNVLRADSFDAMVKNLGKKGEVTDAEAKAIASFINIATGRGQFGKLEQSVQFLNTVFFAPKYVASRFQLILDPLTGFSITSGIPFTKGSQNRVRKAVAAEYGKFLLGAGVVLGLSKLAGADIETDPDESDFGKIRIGNTRMDPLGGLSQTSVLLTRTGQVAYSTGKVGFGARISREERKQRRNFPRLTGTFLRQKLSPAFSSTYDAASGYDVMGNPITPAMAYSRLVVPLSFGDVREALIEQGVPAGTALSLVSLFGVSMSTYEKGKRDRVALEPWEVVARDLDQLFGQGNNR